MTAFILTKVSGTFPSSAPAFYCPDIPTALNGCFASVRHCPLMEQQRCVTPEFPCEMGVGIGGDTQGGMVVLETEAFLLRCHQER